MSCYSQATSSFPVLPYPGRRRRPVWMRAFTMIFEAFHEALEMRRAAYRRYRLSDE
jgi:hypothetical protein